MAVGFKGNDLAAVEILDRFGQRTLLTLQGRQANPALPAGEGWVLASNAFAAYGDRLPAGPARLDALPTARALLRLAPALLAAHRTVPADQALPLYIRDKVAQTTAEREAQRATAGA